MPTAACAAGAAVDHFGRFDFLVNNAGRTKLANHENMDALEAEDVIDAYRLNTILQFQKAGKVRS